MNVRLGTPPRTCRRASSQPYGVRKPTAFFCGQFRFAAESLDDTRRGGAQSPEPVADQMPMTPLAPGNLLHRANLAAHRAGAPASEKLCGLLGARVLPEPPELLAKQMVPDTLEVVPQDLLKSRPTALGVPAELMA